MPGESHSASIGMHAIAVVLLAGTGAAIRAVVDLDRAPAGYDPTRVTIAQIYLQVGAYTDWAARVALYQRLRSEVRSEPVVERATISLIPTGPPPTTGVVTRVEAEGLRAGDREVLAHSVASDYFSTLKMPLVRGRGWSAADEWGRCFCQRELRRSFPRGGRPRSIRRLRCGPNSAARSPSATPRRCRPSL